MRLVLTVSLGVATTLIAAGNARAAEYYVAPTGSDSAAGTMAAPWATLQKAINTAVAGDTVWIRGGTYRITTPATSGAGVNFNKSGTSDTNRIKYWAYPGEVPLFDFSGLTISTSGYTNGVSVSGSWIHLKGLEVANVPMNMYSNNGISVNNASNDIFESLNLHHNSGTGLFIGNGMDGHLVLNSDSHDNYDPSSNQGNGQNADGFGVHWVLRSVARVCQIAGVPAVTPHGLRGTHATLAVGAGISGDAVAASLGHESFAVTAAHYAQPDAVSGAKAAKVADTLG